MKLEVLSDLPPREVVAQAVATLTGGEWTIRSLTENHVHVGGPMKRSVGPFAAYAVGALAAFAVLTILLVFDVNYRVGSVPAEGVLILYGIFALASILVWGLVLLVAGGRQEAGVVVAALPADDGGSRVFAQAFGSAFARDEGEAFVERIQRPADAGEPVRLADRLPETRS